MANNVQFESSVPATPSSATIVQTVQQGDASHRQVISVGDFWGSSAGSLSVTQSSNLTITPSSAIQVGFVGTPAVTVASGTITPSSVVSVTPSSAVTIAGTISLSSNPTVILSSNPTITSVSSVSISIISGANVANVVAGSSAVTSTMSALVVALSTLGPVSITGSSQVLIIGGSAANNTANVLAGSSTVTSTMASLVVSISSNGAGIIGTGTPTTPSSQYISAVVVGDLGVGGANSSASNPVAIGGIYNSTNPTSVSSGQRVQAWFDKSGKLIVNSALRTLKGVQLTSLSSTTTETNITPSSSGGNFLDIYGLILANLSSANTQQVTIKDSSGGTSRAVLEVPFGDTRGFMLPVDAAIPQSASSQAWTATLSNSSGGFQVTALYVTNV